MATGIPDSNGTKRNGTLPYELSYPGKRAPADILATTPASLSRALAVEGQSPASRLILGDNLPVMASLLHDADVRGRVRLVYIDPPFGTNSRFESRRQDHAYSDYLVGASYLEFVRQRLIMIRELLADDGSAYVHVDDNMAFPVKILMDEVFGPRNFRNWITRKKSNPKNYTRRTYGNVADYILFYTKTETYVWNQQFYEISARAVDREYRHVEANTGRRYMKVPVHAPGVRRGETGKLWRGVPPPPGKHWQYPPATLDALDARGEIVWSDNGNPRRKVYLDTRPGVPLQDIWLDYRDAHNQNIAITGYPTEKNLDLLRLIVSASSGPGDLVLDCFCGSGTTVVAAEELGRNWIAVDNAGLAIATTLRRLVEGSDRMGDYVANGRAEQARLGLGRGGVLQHAVELLVADSVEADDLDRFLSSVAGR